MSTPDSSDTHFFNSFSVVLGLLIAFTIVLFGFARVMGRDYQTARQVDDPLIRRAIEQNTMPFGREAIAGPENGATAAHAAAPAAAHAAPPAAPPAPAPATPAVAAAGGAAVPAAGQSLK